MLKHKLKFNESKTKLIVNLSSHSKYKFDDLFVTDGTSNIFISKVQKFKSNFNKHLNVLAQVCKSTYLFLKKVQLSQRDS